MHSRRGDKEALANATTEAWKSHLSAESFTQVCNCLEAAGNINIMKKIEYLIPTTCLSAIRVFETKS
jgi:hypothetical protein